MITDVAELFPQQLGRYVLLGRIAVGGMAEVFRAKVVGAQAFERPVAIKRIHTHLARDPEFVDMFVDEARLSAQLSHGNIVQIYELASIDEQLVIAMELIEGHDLRHVIHAAAAAGNPLPYAFVAYVIHWAATGLDHAHRRQGLDGEPLHLVHRDISPQNILVSFDGEVKVADFGIAKARARITQTREGSLKGRLAYMAPEYLGSGAVDRRSDIFALGSVLFECLTGEPLFGGDSEGEVLHKVERGEVPDVRSIRSDVPVDLLIAMEQALQRNPEHRYLWASQFAAALEPMLIQAGRIFDQHGARATMTSLYADEIKALRERQRRDQLITLKPADAQPTLAFAAHGSRLIDSSDFLAGPTTAASPADTSWIQPVAQVEPHVPAVASRPASRPRAAPQRRPIPRRVWVLLVAALMLTAAAFAFRGSLAGVVTSQLAAVEMHRVSIVVDSVPAGAEVRIGGRHVGTTPGVFEAHCRTGERDVLVTLDKPGHERVRSQQTCPADNVLRLRWILSPELRGKP